MSPRYQGQLFTDRIDAGRKLAGELTCYAGRSDVVVLGLARGGVPVAAEVAARCGAPLDVLLVRKLGVPGNEEFAMGALASGGGFDWNDEVVERLSIPASMVERVIERELAELELRERAYRRGRRPLDLAGKTVILVDDGLATGSTMRAAVAAVRRSKPARVVVAVPVGAPESCAEMRSIADECVCASEPDPFRAVGLWYRDFRPTSDAEVVACLAQADREAAVRGSRTAGV